MMLAMLRSPSTAGLLVMLILAEIGKIGSAILSRNKTITSSSTYSTWVPQNALDGNPRRDGKHCGCCATTAEQFNPWYELELGRNYTVYRIHVEVRNDHINQHLKSMQIYLKSVHDNSFTGEETRIADETYNVNYVLPEPTSTRFVSLVLFNVRRVFSICELTVYGECDDGKSGDYCESVCQCDGDPCINSVCPSGRCLPGYEGASCDMYCSDGTYGSGCTDSCGNCYGTDICNKHHGRCPHGCENGYQGEKCSQECTDGFYGKGCNYECGHCQSEEPCNKVTGRCEDGCEAGYRADFTCKAECTPGNYGIGCTKQCGNCKFGATCAKANGSCPAGCNGDYTGETCKSVCTAGFYGENCNNECGHCVNGEPCDPETGVCGNGCSAGYQTTLCNTECNRGTYGLGCSQYCGNCRGGDFCVFTDGTCTNGCEAGYMGDACKTETLEEQPAKCSLILTISGWLFGGVTVLAAVGFFVALKIRSRRTQQKPPMTDTSLYTNPRNSRIEEERSYDYDYPTVNI